MNSNALYQRRSPLATAVMAKTGPTRSKLRICWASDDMRKCQKLAGQAEKRPERALKIALEMLRVMAASTDRTCQVIAATIRRSSKHGDAIARRDDHAVMFLSATEFQRCSAWEMADRTARRLAQRVRGLFAFLMSAVSVPDAAGYCRNGVLTAPGWAPLATTRKGGKFRQRGRIAVSIPREAMRLIALKKPISIRARDIELGPQEDGLRTATLNLRAAKKHHLLPFLPGQLPVILANESEDRGLTLDRSGNRIGRWSRYWPDGAIGSALEVRLDRAPDSRPIRARLVQGVPIGRYLATPETLYRHAMGADAPDVSEFGILAPFKMWWAR